MHKERLEYLDVIKGVAILLVVMGHVLTMCIRNIDQAFVFKLIGETHMPLFFFISGFFTYKANNNTTFTTPNLFQRFKQLIIPFFIVSSLWLLYFPHSKLDSPLHTTISGLYTDVWKNGYWFTLCLFEIILIYSLNCIIFKRIKSVYCHFIAILIITTIIGITSFYILPQEISNLLSLPLVFQFYPIFMIGVMAKKFQGQFLNFICDQRIFTLNLLIAVPLIYSICYYWELPWLPIESIFILKYLFHITLACIAIKIAKVWCNENHNISIKIFSKLGKESLSIYLLHYFFLFPLGFLQEPLREMGLSVIPTVITALLVAIIIISFVLAINYSISQSKILALLLTGKNYNS